MCHRSEMSASVLYNDIDKWFLISTVIVDCASVKSLISVVRSCWRAVK